MFYSAKQSGLPEIPRAAVSLPTRKHAVAGRVGWPVEGEGNFGGSQRRDPAERKSPVRVGKPRSPPGISTPRARARGSYLDYGRKESKSERIGTVPRGKKVKNGESEEGERSPVKQRDAERQRGENGETRKTVTPSPNLRAEGFHLASLCDRNRWDPINLPLRGSQSLLSHCTY